MNDIYSADELWAVAQELELQAMEMEARGDDGKFARSASVLAGEQAIRISSRVGEPSSPVSDSSPR